MANEKRLIDANALSDKVAESKHNNPHPLGMVRVNHRNEHDHFLRMILDTPTVDAVEVVHGRWEKHLAPYTDDYWTCTCCNGNFMTDAAQYWKYCPNCGAKMDGGGNA